MKKLPPVLSFKESGVIAGHKKTAVGPNVIQFPGKNPCTETRLSDLPLEQFSVVPFLGIPGMPFPSCIPDYRPLLQRDGLILLSWDKRITEMGDLYTAYWVTSAGMPRFYASKPYSSEDFILARPHHKSYAAEDGIEFYGQDAPAYMVHVAPELMKSNPRHGELRLVHINTLKQQGSDVDFDYRFLLTLEKNRLMAIKKHNRKKSQCAGA